MKSLTLLDTSLRDGGHRTNFHFSNQDLHHVLTPLDNSGIEYIEIGYRNGSLHPIENLGRAGFCDKEYLLFCKSLVKKAKIAVMVHPKLVDESDLNELKNCGVDLIRLCIEKNQLAPALPLITLAKNIGLQVSVNFIHLTYYSDDELSAVVNKASLYQPDLIYFADSNGSILPARLQEIFEQYTHNTKIAFGFHAHDNIGLAQANALAALSGGACFIDASLAGMGKGIGNLKTEFFVAYLHAIKMKTYNLEELLAAANYLRQSLNIGSELITMDEFTRGISDLSTADLKLAQQNKSRLGLGP